MSYSSEYGAWCQDPVEFWRKQAMDVAWFEPPTQILASRPDGTGDWFSNGTLNTCYLSLDHHIENGRGEQTALIYDSPSSGKQQRYSYQELLDRTVEVAAMLRELGVERGDTVIIYMPMIPQAAISMLACARIGAIHSVVFGGFAAPELASRIDDACPKVILAASCGIEINRIIEYKPLIDAAINLAEYKPKHTVVFQREQSSASLEMPGDLDWRPFIYFVYIGYHG